MRRAALGGHTIGTGLAASAKPSDIAAAAAKHGMEVIDSATAESLRRDAAEGRRIAAAAAAAKAKVEAAVDNAIDRGKVRLARRKHWIELIAPDPGMADVLAGIPDETAVPLSEAGHSSSSSASSTVSSSTGRSSFMPLSFHRPPPPAHRPPTGASAAARPTPLSQFRRGVNAASGGRFVAVPRAY